MGRADVLAEMIRGGDVGADAVDKSNDHRFNLLMVASMSGMKVVCKRLLGLGADVSAVDKHGHTALDLALKYGHDATADYLGRVGVPLGRKERDFPEYTPHVPERNAHEASAPPVPTHFTGQAQEQSIFPEQEQQGIVPYGETSSPGSTASLPRDEGPLLSPE
jgi:ankyrin repeat protein